MRCNSPRHIGLDWLCCPVDAADSQYDPTQWHSKVAAFHTKTQVYIQQVINKEDDSL